MDGLQKWVRIRQFSSLHNFIKTCIISGIKGETGDAGAAGLPGLPGQMGDAGMYDMTFAISPIVHLSVICFRCSGKFIIRQ